ncbi:hypothetical protein [Benzoatithermus flavus]|uniref:Uncharacterized protein n=1 Tax=Benzoatithermus flavus TaxID=3108223 RepID=A0ABU8XXE9_9PROT
MRMAASDDDGENRAGLGPAEAEFVIADRDDLILPQESPPTPLDRTRAWLAYALLGLFAVEVLAALAVGAFDPANSEAILKILDKVVTPTVGLVGAVSAFYYARERT